MAFTSGVFMVVQKILSFIAFTQDIMSWGGGGGGGGGHLIEAALWNLTNSN